MRFYRLLLHLYPASFRREYGAEMAADFAARRRDAAGPLARLALGIGATFDVAGNAFLAHVNLLRQDLRYARRSLWRRPSFAIAAIAVVAIGVGANTAAFSVADYTLLHPLPFPHPDRLVSVWERPQGYNMLEASPPNYRDWRVMSRSFDAMGAWHWVTSALTGTGTPQELTGTAVHGDLLSMLGAAPMMGRLFSGDEYRQGTAAVLLSAGLWKATFGADPAIVGRTVVLDGAPYVVTGVMPPSFVFPDRTSAFWIPMAAPEVADTDRSNNWFTVVARLRPGLTIEQAQRDMGAVAAQLAVAYPEQDRNIGATVIGLRETFMRMSWTSPAEARLLLFGLCGAALCVLLIGCANLANLLVVRAMARRRELAVRTALGAGRERLVRQLLTESLALAVAGGALGVVLAVVLLPLLTRLVPETLPMSRPPSTDLRTLAIAVVVTLATGVGFGVAPALGAGRGASFDALRDGARAGGGRRARLRAGLVVSEVVLSVVLLVSTGLLARAIWRIRSVDPGFHADHVMTLRTTLPYYRYADVAPRADYYRRILDAVRALPGVEGAGFSSWLPMTMGGGIWPVIVPGRPAIRSADNTASLRFITPGYLGTMEIGVKRGRDVNAGDVHSAPFAAVVSESFAKRYWPGRDPIGETFTFAFHQRTVVGVVNDVRVRGPERVAEPQVYLPYQQVDDSEVYPYAPRDLAVRSSLPEAALVPALRRIIRGVDSDQPVTDVRTMQQIVDQQTAVRTMQARMLAAFAVIALVLAAVGIHGVLAFAVSQRRQEFGIRMALGARTGTIMAMVVRESVALTLAGVIPGSLAAYLAGRAMQSGLAGVDPGDPLTFGAVLVLAVIMVGVGTWSPVRRALAIEPTTAIRSD